MVEKFQSQSEVQLIEQAAERMAKRLNRTYIADPKKRQTFEASASNASSRNEPQIDQARLRQHA